jgi:hypothetical protein
MKANELRIGNYYDYNGQVIKVTPNTILGLWKTDRTLVQSIPITEEWLKRFGFIKSPAGNSIYLPMPELKAEIHFELFRSSLVCVLYCSTGSFIPNDIKYVHQLQNLYFALTGEELKEL